MCVRVCALFLKSINLNQKSILTTPTTVNQNLKELHEMVLDSSLDTDLRSEAASDIAATEETLHTLSTALTRTLVPPHPFAHLPALLEVRPGTGGSEASLFANDLLRMYTTYCTSIRNWPVSIVSQTPTSEGGGGITEVIFEVDAPGAYDLLRVEAGVHRVQRVPATEKQGRTHTSTATVMVLPSFPSTELAEGEEDPESIIDMKDVRVDIMRARGAGGQHVNTTDSAVRMTHLPTGLVAAIQDSRSQHKNREKCLQVLKSRVAEKRRTEREAEELSVRRGVAKVGAGRADKLRTYNYIQVGYPLQCGGGGTNRRYRTGSRTIDAGSVCMISRAAWMGRA